MAKIIAPNAEYNGESASVKFENGVGETSDSNLIGWFLEHGYTVEETEVDETEVDEIEVETEVETEVEIPVSKPKSKSRK